MRIQRRLLPVQHSWTFPKQCVEQRHASLNPHQQSRGCNGIFTTRVISVSGTPQLIDLRLTRVWARCKMNQQCCRHIVISFCRGVEVYWWNNINNTIKGEGSLQIRLISAARAEFLCAILDWGTEKGWDEYDRVTQGVGIPSICTYQNGGRDHRMISIRYPTKRLLGAARLSRFGNTPPSGRASFWGDAYTVRKWTRNLRTKILKCVAVPTKRNRVLTHLTTEFDRLSRVQFEMCWNQAYPGCQRFLALGSEQLWLWPREAGSEAGPRPRASRGHSHSCSLPRARNLWIPG